MADNSLSAPVVISALGISAASLPAGLSPAYQMYILNQTMDFTNVAGKANEAGQGAYDAQVRNEEQDVILDDHEARLDAAEATLQDHETRITDAEARITANEAELADHETRITQNETDISTLQSDVSGLDGRLGAAETDIDSLQADYVSKSVLTSQSLASPLNVTTSYSVGGTKVVGARVTGWTAAIGTSVRTAFNVDAVYTVSATYTQSEVQAISSALRITRQRLKGIEDALRAHGMID